MTGSSDLLEFVARSENRRQTLESLVSGPITRAEVQEHTGIPRSTLNRILSDCLEHDLLVKNGHHYRTTLIGRYIATRLQELESNIETMADLQGILEWLPLDTFDFDINAFENAEVFRQRPADPHDPVRTVIPVLEGATSFRGLCDNAAHEPIFAEWRAVTEGGQRFEALLTPEVIDVIANDPVRADRFSDMLEIEGSRTYRYDGDIPCIIVIADDSVLLEAADEDGAIKGFVISDHPDIRAWAEATYESCKRKADPVGVGELTP